MERYSFLQSLHRGYKNAFFPQTTHSSPPDIKANTTLRKALIPSFTKYQNFFITIVNELIFENGKFFEKKFDFFLFFLPSTGPGTDFYFPKSSFFHFESIFKASIGVILSVSQERISEIIISSSLKSPGVFAI